MIRTRHLSEKEIYEEVCDDVTVDIAFEGLVYALIDEDSNLKVKVLTDILVKRLTDAVEKLRNREVESEAS